MAELDDVMNNVMSPVSKMLWIKQRYDVLIAEGKSDSEAREQVLADGKEKGW